MSFLRLSAINFLGEYSESYNNQYFEIMSGYIVKSGNYRFDDLGVIHVNVKNTAKSITARWRGPEIVVSVPRNIPYDLLLKSLREMMPRIKQREPQRMYNIGDVFDFGDLVVEIASQQYAPDRILAEFVDKGRAKISIGSAWDLDHKDTAKTISKFMCRLAQNVAPAALIPQAMQRLPSFLASLWRGKSPMGRVLGKCDSKGVISLSYVLVFYPPHLREYVICHEPRASHRDESFAAIP